MENENNELEKQSPAAKPNISALLIAAFLGVCALASVIVVLRGTPARKTPSITDDDGMASLLSQKKDGVGWVYLRGIISEGSSSNPFERNASAAKRLRSLADRKEVKAIVLDINSPGGTVAAVQELYGEIMRARKQKHKPVIALFRDVAASGGYYAACACDQIIAQPGTLTGSIGVIFSAANVEGLFQKVGVKSEIIKSGKFKDIGSIYRAMTPEERKLLQGVIDDAYAQFFDAVKAGRRVPEEKLKELADGRIFTGRQAAGLGLVDKLGGAKEALEAAGELSGLGKEPRVIKEADAWDYLLSVLRSRSSLPALALSEISAPRLAYIWTY